MRLAVLSPAGKKRPAATLCGPGWMLYTVFVLNVTPRFLASLVTPIFCRGLGGKRTRTNRQLLAMQGFFDLSLLCHKGTHLRPWHCKMGWTSKPSPGCWATTQPDSPWTPTPTSPPPRRGKRRIRWAASSPVLSGSFRTFRRTQRARAGSKRRSRQLPASLVSAWVKALTQGFTRIIST